MSNFLQISCIFFFLTLSSASQIIPIPRKSEGATLGTLAASKVHLEAHYDLLCPDCRDSFKDLTTIIEEFDLLNKNFTMTVHFFPWAFHTYSFLTTVAAKFIQSAYPHLIFPYIQAIFDNQSMFSNENISVSAAKNLISGLVYDKFEGEVGFYEVLNALNNQTYNNMARVSLKIGNQRGVISTPTYFVNDVRLDESKTYGYEDWVDFVYEFVEGWEPSEKSFLN